ncbi:response regulator transcription factor [Endozoicomonas arenosclerae]|uniref:response regulator transcription factor n=1 Tax=Endozoicomonas arenosclerae TaxID=1633495 RepID=UPI000781CA54|nr:response regulator transcription factor [Endozoicomonas arenosclerae]
MNDSVPTASNHHPKILLVDDDQTFCQVLARAFRRRDLDVRVAHSAEQGEDILNQFQPDLAVIDLKMSGASGLTLIPHLLNSNPKVRILVLTGYASIATAVEAIRLGATNYLCKPADAEQILAALFSQPEIPHEVPVPEKPISLERLEYEHIQRILLENEGNISETARQLNMHRRTLQRKLGKNPVKA